MSTQGHNSAGQDAGIGHNSQNRQTVYRRHGNRAHTAILNSFLQDSRISHETKGLVAEMLSYPEDWDFTVQYLTKNGRSGRDKVYRMLKEAEKFGYIIPFQYRALDGKIQKQTYLVSDDPEALIRAVAEELHALEKLGVNDPLPEKAEVAKPLLSNPLPEKPETEIQEMDQPLPEKPDRENPTQTKNIYNKTDSSLRSESADGDDQLSAEDLVWGNGLRWVVKAGGLSERKARPIIGRWLKVLTHDELLHAMRSAKSAKTGDPVAYIGAIASQAMQTIGDVRRENGRIVVAGDFKAELTEILNGRDLQRALDQLAGKIPIGLSGVELQTKVRSLAIEMMDRIADQDRRYLQAANANRSNKDPTVKPEGMPDHVWRRIQAAVAKETA